MNKADKNQTGLFPAASQDMTGNSNDSEQNLQLLKLDSSSQKVPEATHELENRATGKNQPFTEGRKTWLTSQLCCVHYVHLYTNICSIRVSGL